MKKGMLLIVAVSALFANSVKAEGDMMVPPDAPEAGMMQPDDNMRDTGTRVMMRRGGPWQRKGLGFGRRGKKSMLTDAQQAALEIYKEQAKEMSKKFREEKKLFIEKIVGETGIDKKAVTLWLMKIKRETMKDKRKEMKWKRKVRGLGKKQSVAAEGVPYGVVMDATEGIGS